MKHRGRQRQTPENVSPTLPARGVSDVNSTRQTTPDNDRFGAAVGGAAGGEVGQERCSPLAQRPVEPGDLWDRAGRERRKDLLRDPATVGEIVGVVGVAELLSGLPGDVALTGSLCGPCFLARRADSSSVDDEPGVRPELYSTGAVVVGGPGGVRACGEPS